MNARAARNTVVNKKVVLIAAIAAIAGVIAAVVIALTGRRHHEDFLVEAFDSRVLGERRECMVVLPEGYMRDTSRRYPVLYVLDGGSQAEHTARSARLMARSGVMPEVIVIGLPSSGENRARDYTPPYMRAQDNGDAGHADRFLRFMETELIPHIDRTYRTTNERMLAGWSRGGLFVVYSLLERPELFRARFAHSPALWRDDDRIIAEMAAPRAQKSRATGFLYLSLGNRENEKMTRAFRKATRELQRSALRWRADITRGADHQKNPVLATPAGFRAYYAPPRFRRSTTFSASSFENSPSR